MREVQSIILGCFIMPLSAEVILDDDFDDAIVNGWTSLGNTLGADHTITESGSELTSRVVANQGNLNTHRGIVSTISFDPSTDGLGGFSLHFEVSSQGALAPGANGMFLGITDSNSVFFRTTGTSSFGLTFFGFTSRTQSQSGVSLVTDDLNTGGSATEGLILNGNPNTIQLSSFQDGFEATLNATQLGWSFEISGINTTAGVPTTLLRSGTWAAAGTDYSTIFASSTNWYVLASNQGDPSNNTHTVVYDRITLTTELATDTDNDGMPDSYEMANGTNINLDDSALDLDEDGLTNFQEFLGQNSAGMVTGFGQTKSGSADSDGDNLNDNDEITGRLNPWVGRDKETPPGDATNPNQPDSDHDGVDDGAEIIAGTNPNAPPPNTGPTFPFIDRDGDRYRDEAEVAFGSDPDNASSIPDHRGGIQRPNILVIYADDLGFGDMSAYGDLFGTSSPARTPNLDALASAGVMFTQAHSSNAVCTPSRYALLTGKYNWREFDGITLHYGGTKGGQEVPRPTDLTLAEYLKDYSYDTAAFGKWHLGGAWYTRTGTRITNNPTTPATIDWARPIEHHAIAQGFDSFSGLAVSINVGPYVYLKNDRVQFWDSSLNGGLGAYRDALNSDPFRWFTTAELNSTVFGGKDSRASLGDPNYTQVGAGPKMVTDVEEWFAARANANDTDPFFAYVSLYSPHLPWAVTPDFQNSVGFDYGDFMKEVDDRIGRVITALDENGFGEDTMVIFSSDNGPENLAMTRSLSNNRDPNGPLRGNKRDVWEGGTRVPFVVRWPGQAAPGIVVDDLVWQGDIFATIAAYLRDELPNEIAPDGESFLNLIRGQRKPSTRRPSVVVSSNRGDLGLKTVDGWKFIDGTGGGDNNSWDSENSTISGAAGTNRGTPKQLFELSQDLGEDRNLIASDTNVALVRSNLIELVGTDLLADLDTYRIQSSAARFGRKPDNDGDGMSNEYELAENFDPDWPLDADQDADHDGQRNGAEERAGTDPRNPSDFLRILNLNDNGTEITINWPSVLGVRYRVAWSMDLENWNDESNHIGDGAELTTSLEKSIFPETTRVFLRVAVID